MVNVSTIIPAYNAERTIAQTINSALSQDCEQHEVVVVNDGSTDSTAAILNGYGNRIKVVTQRNGGVSAARNAGVRHSTGKYLAFLDADDLWLSKKIKTVVSELERHPKASLGFDEQACIDSSGVDWSGPANGHAPSMEELMCLYPITPSTWVIPRFQFDRTPGFCEQFDRAGGYEDHWMLLLLRELGEFVYIREKLTGYRLCETRKLADKYGPALPMFISLARKRYGTGARVLIQNAKNRQCGWLLSKIAYQMNDGDRWGAIRSLVCIAKLRPAFLMSSNFSERLFLPQNMQRLRNLISLRSRRPIEST